MEEEFPIENNPIPNAQSKSSICVHPVYLWLIGFSDF